MARPRPRLDEIPSQMTPDQFWELVGAVEHEGLDFKGGPNESLERAIPAMAMTDGGLLILGVDDRRQIVGCQLTQRVQDRIAGYAKECHVTVELREVRVGSHKLTIVEVPEVRGRIVTTPDGRLLRRLGGASESLRGDAIARFVQDRGKASAEEEPLGRPFDPTDFDLGAVNAALASQGRPAVALSGLGRALADLQVAEYAGDPAAATSLVVFKAAAVLFARDPRTFVPGAEIQLLRRDGVGPGPGPARARQRCSGPLVETIDCCLRFIEEHTRQFEVVTTTYRETLPEYPDSVIREALLNGVAHRDYGLSGATIDVTLWDDRIEFHSPGPLPGHITVDNMRFEHFSRNRRIMRVLRDIGLVEEFGEGVDRMHRAMEERLMLPPTFTAAEASLTVTLHNSFLVSVEDQAWLQLLASGPGPESAEERRTLVEARQAGQVPKRRLAELMPDVDVGQLVSTLVAKGLLVRVGRAGGTQYELSPEVTARVGGSGIETQLRRRQMLLDEMARMGSLSAREATAVLHGDGRSARALMGTLVAAGLVVAEGNTRARRYRLAKGAEAAPPDGAGPGDQA